MLPRATKLPEGPNEVPDRGWGGKDGSCEGGVGGVGGIDDVMLRFPSGSS